jgi:hypothetical protein
LYCHYGQQYTALALTSAICPMYLLVYPSLGAPRRPKMAAQQLQRPVSVGVDFVTPDGTVVPRAAGEAALLGHTAVLVGGLLVGIWPQG